MNDFTTEIVQTLVTKGDLNELFRSHLEKAINTLLRTELTAFLDYEKYDRTGFNSVYWSSFLVTLCSEIMLYIETPLVSYSYSLNEVSHSCTS